ncbi:sulfite exporter TauE/SafE family protein [Xanthobacter variabilis]|uniref:sulfite exporter TauE/SafE family protein n=1 Tax=Xanthobacter variabilis TaxID=3119932 RepID=UPI00374EF63F
MTVSAFETSVWVTIIEAAVFVLAGVVKGVTGMGLPTVAMGLLGAFLSPVSAAGLMVIPSFVTNAVQLASGPNITMLVSRLWPMLLGIVCGTIAGVSMLAGGDTHLTTAGLGVALVVYAVYALVAHPFVVAPRWERYLSMVIGLATGLVTGCTGVFVIPAVPYLQSLRFDRDDLVQALGLSFTVSTVALAVGLAAMGAWSAGDAGLSIFAVIPALIGMLIGQWLRRRISPPAFRRWFLIFLGLLGMELALRGLLN